MGQSGPDVLALFPEGLGVAFEGEKDPGARVGPEPARDLLSDLDHAEILFGLIVGKRDLRVEIESHDLSLVFLEPPEEILGGSGLGASPGGGLSGTSRLRPSPGEDLRKCGEDGIPVGFVGRGCPVFRPVVHVEKEGLHLRRPEMEIELFDGRQLPKEVGVAERMQTGIGEVRSPEVVHDGSLSPIDDTQGLDALLAPFFVKSQKGQERGRGDVAPAERRLRTESRLVSMQDRGLDQQRADALHEGGKAVGQETAGFQDGAFAHHRAKEVGAELSDPVDGKGLILVQVSQGGLEPRSVLGRSGHPLGSRGGDLLPAGRAACVGQTVFGDGKAGLRKIEDLTGFVPRGNHPGEIRPAGTGQKRNIDHPVRDRNGEKRVTAVSLLSSRLLSGRGPKTFGRGFPISVARWRLGTVLTVLVQADLELPDLVSQNPVLFFHAPDLCFGGRKKREKLQEESDGLFRIGSHQRKKSLFVGKGSRHGDHDKQETLKKPALQSKTMSAMGDVRTLKSFGPPSLLKRGGAEQLRIIYGGEGGSLGS